MGDAFFSGNLATIYYFTEVDIQLTWQVFRQFSDKDWSTDCSSKVVMEKLGVTQAFSFDRYFRHFGLIAVVP
ncbi:MAG: twitching motility protein PilT [Okeania sp. SIO2C9]|nr:twitching motility protein PilT [Okeania sp. SIO2C9]